jgi:heterotetrameric sarcosine oxidase gamma subunit
MNEPVKHSPVEAIAREQDADHDIVDGWQLPLQFSSEAYERSLAQQAVALMDGSANGKIRIEGQQAGDVLRLSDLNIGEGREMGYGQVFRLRRDLYFVKSSPEQVTELTERWETQAALHDSLVTVSDVTHGNAELWLIGPASTSLLSRLCSLDLQSKTFPDMSVRQSSVAKTSQIILRRDLGSLPAFALVGPRSLAAYLWQTIMQAGQDLGIGPMGRMAWTSLPAEKGN